ncbi:MAG: response regulator, partial [Thermoplasmatota archaeon]
DSEYPRLSGNMGCDASVVLQGVFESHRPSTIPVSGVPMNLDKPEVRAMDAKSGGYTTQPQPSGSKAVARVVVVDDQDFIRELYKDFLESKGITVFAARDGDEAVRVFKSMTNRPDAIIMDHRMPGKDGIETTKEILRIDPRVPIIFSSADESVREDALAAGAVSFWAKPFPVSLLVNAMLDIVQARKRTFQ